MKFAGDWWAKCHSLSCSVVIFRGFSYIFIIRLVFFHVDSLPINCVWRIKDLYFNNFIIFYVTIPICVLFFRYHLQAFRHLYVLACEKRIVIPRDVDTNQACYVELELVYKVAISGLVVRLDDLVTPIQWVHLLWSLCYFQIKQFEAISSCNVYFCCYNVVVYLRIKHGH
jgi:hypothetical protein